MVKKSGSPRTAECVLNRRFTAWVSDHGDVEILLWLLPSGLVLIGAMIWVSWLGRERTASTERSDAANERFAEAILREHPGSVRTRSAPRDRSTGIAVRPSRSAGSPDSARRSA